MHTQEKFGELGVFMIVCNARPTYYMAENAADWVTEVNALLKSRERELSSQMNQVIIRNARIRNVGKSQSCMVFCVNQAAALDAGVAEEDESTPEGNEEAEEGVPPALRTSALVRVQLICHARKHM